MSCPFCAPAFNTGFPECSHWHYPVRRWRNRVKSISIPIVETKLIQPLLDAFTKDTGIKVNVISASSGLEQRIKTEGTNSPADVLLTVDIGRIEEAVQSGITQPIKSAALDKVIPAQYRDPEGHWYGVSLRARVVYVSKERVKDTAITYEELADPSGRARFASVPASTCTITH